MKLGYVFIEKIEKANEELKALRIRYNRIDSLLDRQAFNSISDAEIQSLNEESEQIEARINELTNDKLPKYFEELKSILNVTKESLKELKEEEKSIAKRITEILEIVKRKKTNITERELKSLKTEYSQKIEDQKTILERIERREKAIQDFNSFLSSNQPPKRRI